MDGEVKDYNKNKQILGTVNKQRTTGQNKTTYNQRLKLLTTQINQQNPCPATEKPTHREKATRNNNSVIANTEQLTTRQNQVTQRAGNKNTSQEVQTRSIRSTTEPTSLIATYNRPGSTPIHTTNKRFSRYNS
jgi:hypothetical protein